jgi:hypothetical protein
MSNATSERTYRTGRPGPALNGAEVTVTERECPMCRTEGLLTVGGTTPLLRTIEGDERPFCVGTHGWL